MAELLDRAYQRELLNELAALYPKRGTFQTDDRNRLVVNLHYLTEHGLINAEFPRLLSGEVQYGPALITAKGLDFIQDDGGLSAILGVVTVKLHDDTIRRLLIDKVQASEEPDGVKERLVDAIKSAPAETLKTVVQKTLEAGIQSLPNAVQLLQGWLST